jgi:Ca-activated chloride channel family protein
MEMFRFENSEFLWGLLIIPVLALLFIWSRIARKKALQRRNSKTTDALFFQRKAGI